MSKGKNIIQAFREAFHSWGYRLTAIVIAIAFGLFEIWLAHYSLILFVWGTAVFSWRDRVGILWSTIEIFFVNFTLSSQIFAVLIAFLVGGNVTLLIYYLKKQIALQSAAGTSVLGIAASLVGVGCTACGSVILSSFLGFTATIKLLTMLPLRGQEFNLVAILILGLSIYLVSQKIVNPANCKVLIFK